MVQEQHPALLIIAPNWVGDMVMAQSLFKLLKRRQADLQLDVLAPSWSEGLLRRMPEVRHLRLHTLEHGQLLWQERYRIGKQLQGQHYQQAIVLPNSWKSALIPFWANIPRRTGYVGEGRYWLINDWRKLDRVLLPQTVEQFAALGLPKGSVKDSRLVIHPRLAPGNFEFALQRLNLPMPRQPILALCPGAEYGPAKCWPLEYYATVARQKVAEGWQVWLLGSIKDQSIGNRIEALVGKDCLNLCGKTSLAEAVDLLSLVQAVVTNDSGLMHVAAALDKPLIAIYGSSSPSKTPPLSHRAKVLYLGLPCSPCLQRTCRLMHLKCLREISALQVLTALNLDR
jgi:heptosyltransferase-2